MAATPVQEIAPATADGATSVAKAYTVNVTAGNLLVISAARFDGGANTAIIASNFTKSAGTATIGTITLDKEAHVASTDPTQCAIVSVPVTGSGSCTIQFGGAVGGSFLLLQINEYSGVDVSGTRVDGTPSSGTSATGTSPAATGNTTSSGAALLYAAYGADYDGSALNPTIGGSFTPLGTSADGTLHQCGAFARRIVTTGTTDGASWTQSTTSLHGWAAAIVAYKATGGGSATLEDSEGPPLALLRPQRAEDGVVGVWMRDRRGRIAA